MANRTALMQRLSVLSTEDLLKLLPDDALAQMVTMVVGNAQHETKGHDSMMVDSVNPANPSKSSGSDRLKRPLNAFMAFRSKFP